MGGFGNQNNEKTATQSVSAMDLRDRIVFAPTCHLFDYCVTLKSDCKATPSTQLEGYSVKFEKVDRHDI